MELCGTKKRCRRSMRIKPIPENQTQKLCHGNCIQDEIENVVTIILVVF